MKSPVTSDTPIYCLHVLISGHVSKMSLVFLIFFFLFLSLFCLAKPEAKPYNLNEARVNLAMDTTNLKRKRSGCFHFQYFRYGCWCMLGNFKIVKL